MHLFQKDKNSQHGCRIKPSADNLSVGIVQSIFIKNDQLYFVIQRYCAKRDILKLLKPNKWMIQSQACALSSGEEAPKNGMKDKIVA